MAKVLECDRCGKRVAVEYGEDRPKNWEPLDDCDMCGECIIAFREFMRMGRAVSPSDGGQR